MLRGTGASPVRLYFLPARTTQHTTTLISGAMKSRGRAIPRLFVFEAAPAAVTHAAVAGFAYRFRGRMLIRNQ